LIRAFIALPLPEIARDALEDLQSELPVGRHMSPDTFHITLAYLDKQTERTLERIHEVLGQIALPPIPITLKGVDVFGGKSPKLLWAGIASSDELAVLREKVRRASERSGVTLSRERFRPHVTLARFKNNLRDGEVAKIGSFLAAHADFEMQPFVADHFVMFQSTRHQTGATHEPIVDYPLQG